MTKEIGNSEKVDIHPDIRFTILPKMYFTMITEIAQLLYSVGVEHWQSLITSLPSIQAHLNIHKVKRDLDKKHLCLPYSSIGARTQNHGDHSLRCHGIKSDALVAPFRFQKHVHIK